VRRLRLHAEELAEGLQEVCLPAGRKQVARDRHGETPLDVADGEAGNSRWKSVTNCATQSAWPGGGAAAAPAARTPADAATVTASVLRIRLAIASLLSSCGDGTIISQRGRRVI
jgi:hypothetical protein